MKSAAALEERDLLGIVVRLQDEVRTLAARVESAERAATKNGHVRPPARRVSLEAADRLGVLPRSGRTVRKWLSSPELRAIYKTHLFASRIGSRIEVDLVGLEEWRRAMSAPAAPEWPKSFGKSRQ